MAILKEPTIEIPDVKISGMGLEATVLDVTLEINNPLPVGGTIKSTSFRIYLLKNGAETLLGEGGKDGIEIGGSSVTRTNIPVKLKNTAILASAAGLVGGDIEIIIRGNAAIDLKIVAPSIPFEKKTKIEGLLKGLTG